MKKLLGEYYLRGVNTGLRQMVTSKESVTHSHFPELGMFVMVHFHPALLTQYMTGEIRSHLGEPRSHFSLQEQVYVFIIR